MPHCKLVLVAALSVLAPTFSEMRLNAQSTGPASQIDQPQPQLRFEFSTPSMGSQVDFVVYTRSQTEAKKVIDVGLAEIERLSKILSNYDPQSEISQLCSAPKGTWTPLSPDLAAVLQLSRRWHQLSDGKFDITVGPLTQLYRDHRKKKQLPSSASIDAAKRRCGWSSVDLTLPSTSELPKQPPRVRLLQDQMVLDLSGIAVGYILDAAFEKMRLAGPRSLLINAGGDIRVGDAPPGTLGWKIAIAGLSKQSPPLSMLPLQNCAVTTSGDLNQFLEIEGRRYSHFIDPKSGAPIERRQSMTVVAETTVDADAGATALAVLGMQSASEWFDAMPILRAVLVEAGASDSPARLRWLEKQESPQAESPRTPTAP